MVERSEASVPTAFASWSRKVSIDQALVKEIKAMPDMSGRDAAVMDAVARAAVMEKLAMTSEAARIERRAALSRAERDAAEPQEQEAEERAFLERKAAEVAANKERIAQVEEFVGTSFDNLASTVEVGLQAIDSEVSRQTLAAERERELAMEAAAEAIKTVCREGCQRFIKQCGDLPLLPEFTLHYVPAECRAKQSG